nr:uncharacterized protein LOC112994158 isoform X3 [Dromaius novaehollandiae]
MGVHEGQGSMREEVHGEGALRRLQALAGHTLIKRCRSSVRQLKDTGDPSARIGGTTPVSAAQKNAAKDRNRVLAAEIKQIRLFVPRWGTERERTLHGVSSRAPRGLASGWTSSKSQLQVIAMRTTDGSGARG